MYTPGVREYRSTPRQELEDGRLDRLRSSIWDGFVDFSAGMIVVLRANCRWRLNDSVSANCSVRKGVICG